MEIRGGRVFCPDGVFRDTDIYIENGRFTESSSDGHIMNAAGYYIIPGLIDIHMHGCVGYDFSSATVQQIRAMGEYLAGFGVTNFCPAVMSLPEEQMAEAASRVEELDASVVVEDGECDVGGQQQASSRPERGAAERAGGAEGSLRGPGGPRAWRGERAHRGANGASHGAA